MSSEIQLVAHQIPNVQSGLVQELFSFLADWSERFSNTEESDFGRRILPLMLQEQFRSTETDMIVKGRGAIEEARASDFPFIKYSERRLRDGIFDDTALFGEPAWDILLDVAAAEAKGQRLQISAVCVDAGIPSSTVLRWLGILEERGLIRREADERDRRRFYVRLTDLCCAKFSQLQSALGKVGKT